MPTGRVAVAGVSAVETLVALPIVLVAGLGVVQLGLLYRAHHAVGYATYEAARAGSVSHASPESVRDGFARGLAPWFAGASSPDEQVAAIAAARAHVAQLEAVGRLRIEQLAPTAASFTDWAEPARDADGRPMPDLLEIPNDNLAHRVRAARPASGVAGLRDGEAIGSASGHTLADANLLKLRVRYGVALDVPLAGRLIAATLRAWNGCEPPRTVRLGALELKQDGSGEATRSAACIFYGADGRGSPHAPVEASVTLRMQSPARRSGATPAGDPVSSEGEHASGGLPEPADPTAGPRRDPAPPPEPAAGAGTGRAGSITPGGAAASRPSRPPSPALLPVSAAACGDLTR